MNSPAFLAGGAAVPASPALDVSPSSAAVGPAVGAAALVHEFWRRMASNDFASVGELLAEDFVLDWPQSGERFRGAERFVRMNQEYPANGPWRFRLHRVVGGAHDAVSDVGVTDGVQQARVISFFDCDLAAGRVRRLVEFWPEPYAAPTNRAHLAEPIDDAEGEGG
ncbi:MULTISPECIES: nuclear transport factor 2 family protein [Rubrivivax]|uniref:nuclear transport factor 2 family protein n=1 Tax=Rubrivivax TaxID=28067 RepID=UPI00020A45CA|nr:MULTISPECIES: nuclear transport factor 2 family protein [Rubrivivax]EGJ10482.1 hypothetical protein RBXJA2T_09152 [Rubrivivax benzoatilyticus JA2 = ATCC BAA-35]